MRQRRHIIIGWAVVWFLMVPGFRPVAHASGVRTIELRGREYVRAGDVARTLEMRLSVAGKSVSLRSATAELRLEIDSREAEVNGIKIWLNAAPTSRRGAVLIPHLDLTKTIQPLLVPAGNAARVRTVVLDPGHGGRDRGAKSGAGVLEKNVALDVARRLKERLEDAGLAVSLTRTGDATLSLDRRVKIAARRSPDLMVCLHFNAQARGGAARGIETFCLTPAGAASTASARERGMVLAGNRFDADNLRLGFHVQRQLIEATGATDRGVRRARFYVLQYADAPAILVEGGFLSNPDEARLIASAAYRDKIAHGIAAGILQYKRALER